MPKPKALLDTNILTSGLIFLRGNEHKILKLAENKKIILVLPDLTETTIVFFFPKFQPQQSQSLMKDSFHSFN